MNHNFYFAIGAWKLKKILAILANLTRENGDVCVEVCIVNFWTAISIVEFLL